MQVSLSSNFDKTYIKLLYQKRQINEKYSNLTNIYIEFQGIRYNRKWSDDFILKLVK